MKSSVHEAGSSHLFWKPFPSDLVLLSQWQQPFLECGREKAAYSVKSPVDVYRADWLIILFEFFTPSPAQSCVSGSKFNLQLCFFWLCCRYRCYLLPSAVSRAHHTSGADLLKQSVCYSLCTNTDSPPTHSYMSCALWSIILHFVLTRNADAVIWVDCV